MIYLGDICFSYCNFAIIIIATNNNNNTYNNVFSGKLYRTFTFKFKELNLSNGREYFDGTIT